MPTNSKQLEDYLAGETYHPLFICGDSEQVLKTLPAESIDFCMTSPPYWTQREYASGGVGQERHFREYIQRLLTICIEIKRVLKASGSFWLNLGDTYQDKALLGIPWRVAIALLDEQGWILRNDVIWNKIKGPDNARDKLRNVYEHVFHFVKRPKGFYYNVDAVRAKPRTAHIKNGAVVSATGVTGIRYKRQIELSTALTSVEKVAAMQALEEELAKVGRGEISDFRMVIRNQQRTTHSDSLKVSGRAKELTQRGFYFLRYHPDGSKPGDVWEIIPEDTANREKHYAAYPEDLCKIPILATCPPDGLVLDPFCGTGTTNLVAMCLFRKSIGIDISREYIETARQRCNRLL